MNLLDETAKTRDDHKHTHFKRMQTIQTIFKALNDRHIFLFISGYANSGKTTLLDNLAKLGVESFSTSRKVHYIASLLTGEKVDTKDLATRKRFIDFVELGLVNTFSRRTLAESVMKDALEHYNSTGESVVVETIGGAEAVLMGSYLKHHDIDNNDIAYLNVRSSDELPGVDSRELFYCLGCQEYWWETDPTRAELTPETSQPLSREGVTLDPEDEKWLLQRDIDLKEDSAWLFAQKDEPVKNTLSDEDERSIQMIDPDYCLTRCSNRSGYCCNNCEIAVNRYVASMVNNKR